MTVSEALPRLESKDEKIWLETTTLDHGHGRAKFLADRALWSPSRDKAEAIKNESEKLRDSNTSPT
jgi:hypothetical protein